MHSQGMLKKAVMADGLILKYYDLQRSGNYKNTDIVTTTVVFENGLGTTRSFWGNVQKEVSRHFRTIVYDRRGFGINNQLKSHGNIDLMTNDLVNILEKVGDSPVILVGYSAGALIVRNALKSSSLNITGLVFVDPTDELCPYLLDSRKDLYFTWIMYILSATGFMSLIQKKFVKTFSEDIKTDVHREGYPLRSAKAFNQELAAVRECLHNFILTPPQNTDVPVTIISGGLSLGMNPKHRASINRAHRLRSEIYLNGLHVLAEKSGHYIPITEPLLIACEIKNLSDFFLRK